MDPLEQMKQDLFKRLRQIAKGYGGPGEAVEETLISLWRNSEAAGIRADLRGLGVDDRQIQSEAFRGPPSEWVPPTTDETPPPKIP